MNPHHSIEARPCSSSPLTQSFTRRKVHTNHNKKRNDETGWWYAPGKPQASLLMISSTGFARSTPDRLLLVARDNDVSEKKTIGYSLQYLVLRTPYIL